MNALYVCSAILAPNLGILNTTSPRASPSTMVSTAVICLLLILSLMWIGAHAILMPKPIPGIPHNTFARYMPWGDLAKLGVYNWTTGEIFSWLSLQCLQLNSPLIQVFFPSFSTNRPTLVLADLAEIEHIATKRIGEIDRADLMHTWCKRAPCMISSGTHTNFAVHI